MGSGALLPLERCLVIKGQIVKKAIPQDVQSKFLDFASKSPEKRLASIKEGIEVGCFLILPHLTHLQFALMPQILEYGQSEYIRQFGMSIDTLSPSISIDARILTPPVLKYGSGSRQLTIVSLSYIDSTACD